MLFHFYLCCIKQVYNAPEDQMMGLVMNDGRPSRPSSIELRRSYPEQTDGLYSPRNVHSPTEMHYR